ncbi:MAG: methionyl-tRNA formyltransferase [Oscillospiraceae bacterium]
MRILFMGTPDFAAASLGALYRAGFDVVGVFTQPDKPKNRGMKLEASPVKKMALEYGTPVFQPLKLRDASVIEDIKKLEPDLIAVVAYGKILPKNMLDIPPLGCINIHGSVLPSYRGSAPIQWAVLNGEKTTGVTAMYMAEEMDAGDIIAVKETEIGHNETSGELFDRLMVIGADLLVETVRNIERGNVGRTPQNHDEATFAPPIKKELCPIDWSKTSGEILCKIRGLNPWPVATAKIAGTEFKIYTAERAENPSGKQCGTVFSADSKGISIACADGAVRITELQAAGGKRMPAGDYLRGHPICI